MPFLPLPFATSCLLLVALGKARQFPLLVRVAIGAYALQAALIGVKWGFQLFDPLLMASLGSLLPVLTWVALKEITGSLGTGEKRVFLALLIAIPASLKLLELLRCMQLFELVGTAQYLVFGMLLVGQAVRCHQDQQDDLAQRKLASPVTCFGLVGAALLASASLNVIVTCDLAAQQDAAASVLVGYSNFIALLTIAALYTMLSHPAVPQMAGAAHPPRTAIGGPIGTAGLGRCAVPDTPHRSGPVTPPSTPEERQLRDTICRRLDHELRVNKLYRDETLTLKRLSARLGVPERQISRAMRDSQDMGVPQYVNSFRIAEACELLEHTGQPVTEISLAVGFATKSNFNREFARITGVNPSTWRNRSRATGEAQATRKAGVV